jgi:hypothetical protein
VSSTDISCPASVATRVAALRRRRGERSIGRKIGFTDVTIWDR